MHFLKKAYQKLIDEKVDSGKLVGDGVRGEWKAETPLDEVYKDMIESLDIAIKALEQQPSDDCISRAQALHACCDEWNKDYKAIMKSIRQLPSVTPQQTRWIPVSERLPETDGVYLTYIVNLYDIKLSYIMICDYIHPKWFPIDETASSNVVAWMPLPEPYKESEE